jgi:hypothetical protein
MVSEVMRSCGGAVQGVEEERHCQPADGVVQLNRQVDGTTFFTYGSWAVASPFLSNAAESDLLASPGCFGLSVCVAHADMTRTRLLCVVSDHTLTCCDVAVEAKVPASHTGWSDEEVPSAIAALLGRRVQCIVDANAWEGGASRLELTGAPPAGSADWLNARTKWEVAEMALEGGTPLVPDGKGGAAGDVAYMPGGAWVRVAPLGADKAGTLVEVGSVNPEAAEVKTITHEWTPDAQSTGGAMSLSKVRFSKITAVEE